ncbi:MULTISPECIES: 50S ribosomal protein L3 [Arcobacter]|jgi:large subunit ribosomal protein L3|uniref:50S ribosomal protein L3 n=1 Tax=Arcobacter ellisii TaxID=913109 RepID=A0A347U6V1_9BACT|nr:MULTISPECIES: 50S ribosomal protein L3 [Arcobacter]MDY0050941.1 50S ribosomal protein L3 [Aliarcobacter sp.]AXX94579.1 50S ribosomal protein L3 [Arcobacter ellisii]MBD3828875.1 50S ribosomal protein L3 [Arcobacter sp.]MDD3009643.1 50S ribosomal protein L3 [Arcobacter sp.]RXI29199.1 50S ribosomal protein L3 [Arcobacter ellisii]
MEFIVQKIGMSRTVSVPSTAVTLLKVLDAKVCEVTDGVALVSYSNGKKFNKAIEGQQKKFNLSKEFNRFATLTVANTEAGDLDVSGLCEGKVVKSTFKTKGRGFSGAVKRWNFAGGRASHGHRMGKRTGSIGNCEWPGRVQPGKKMPGQYGNTNVSVKNEVISFDAETGILVLKGSVSGANGSLGKVKVAK